MPWLFAIYIKRTVTIDQVRYGFTVSNLENLHGTFIEVRSIMATAVTTGWRPVIGSENNCVGIVMTMLMPDREQNSSKSQHDNTISIPAWPFVNW